ncbi:bacterial dnaA family protein [Mycobacterium kansasii]|uniref:Bacterial dnaA family protein n=2 Tax=Mycobacterium kansasii TaxID=1768 RepID=A0A1V3XDV4_MYCKA|nr:bacterial dnaA family protein [Mycobacterium kansasii]
MISWSHRDRIRSEAAFASLAGAAPIPASSGATVRHRLNRAGDRQLNRALHTVALTRLRFEPTTKAYAARRTAEGKTPERSNDASNALSPARSTGSCRPTPHQSPPSKRRLDRHRSILLIALGTLAAEAGHRVRYTLASKLVNELVEAAEDKQLTKLINHYGRVDLILVDELGYLQLDRRGAELLFQVLTEREERAAIAIASNEPFSSWTKTFTDPRLCAAIVDRLTFAGQIIETGSASYRLAQARKTRPAGGANSNRHAGASSS